MGGREVGTLEDWGRWMEGLVISYRNLDKFQNLLLKMLTFKVGQFVLI